MLKPMTRKLMMGAIMVMLAGLPNGYARGLHHHAGRLTAPASPTVPPSLTPDPRLVGSAPLPPHRQPTRADAGSRGVLLAPDPEETRVDREINSICRGC